MGCFFVYVWHFFIINRSGMCAEQYILFFNWIKNHFPPYFFINLFATLIFSSFFCYILCLLFFWLLKLTIYIKKIIKSIGDVLGMDYSLIPGRAHVYLPFQPDNVSNSKSRRKTKKKKKYIAQNKNWY